MFIVSLTYTVPLAEVDQHIAAHVDYLNKHYAQGHFLASGRKVPRTGGVIVSIVRSRDLLDEIIKEDPFYINGVATYEVTEFTVSMAHDDLQFLVTK